MAEANDNLLLSCNFDNSDGTHTGCESVSVITTDDYMVDFASTSSTSDTGPSEDHTTRRGMLIIYVDSKFKILSIAASPFVLLLRAAQLGQLLHAQAMLKILQPH